MNARNAFRPTIKPKQIALLHVAKAKLHMEDDDYRALLARVAGVQSSKDVRRADFDRLMDEFACLGFVGTGKRGARYGQRLGMATEAQIAYIRELWQKYSGSDDEARLRRLLEERFKVSHLRFLDSEGAQQAITALKSMASRPKRAA